MMRSAAAMTSDVLASPVSTNDALARSAIRKNSLRLLPILTLALIFNFIDRSNVGFAALTMNSSLGLSATDFGLGAGVLSIGYCLFEVPSSLALYRFGARRWLARIMITWGLAAAATGLATGATSFNVYRFVLGVAEAGFFPGVTYFLAVWFPARYRTQALGWLCVGVPVSSLISAPISGLLLQLDGLLGLAGWQWMFIIEGLPLCLIGVATLYLLVDHPKDATWLSAEERHALLDMLANETRENVQKDLWAAFRDVRVLMLTGITFSFTVGAYGVGIWLPLILKGHGLSNLNVGFISAIPYLITTVVMLAWMRLVERTGKKIFNLAAACFLAALALGASVFFGQLVLSLAFVSLALIGAITARTIFWTIPVGFLSGPAAAGGLAFINSVGATGGFVGPFMMGWLKDATGSFQAGMLAMSAILLCATGLSLSLKFFIKQE
jgi:MFS transporter, ACS family, tartrate transporter